MTAKDRALETANKIGRMFQQSDGSQKRFITPEECAEALLAAEREQMERDCRAVCFNCKAGHRVYCERGVWLHEMREYPACCYAADIRKAAADRSAGKE